MIRRILLLILLFNLFILPFAIAQTTTSSAGTIQVSPTQIIYSFQACTAPVCEGRIDTGQVDSNGCTIYSCPSQACTACVGGIPTGEVDFNNCPIYSCPGRTCPLGCICTEDTASCPTTETRPIITTVEVSTGLSSIRIEKKGEQLEIKSEKASAISGENFIIEESKLYFKTSTGNKQIKVLPEEASAQATEITTIKGIEIKEESMKPIYSIIGIKEAKILAIFPTTLEIETKVDATSGKIIYLNKPWWSFLAW